MRADADLPLGRPPALAEYALRAAAGGRELRGRHASGGGAPDAPPLISVITVVRNAAGTVRRAIESVTAAGCAVEYIVVDGGSTDGTLDILREHDAEIDVWFSEPDSGIYDAMNKGIALARGEWIALLNADDWYLDGALAAVAAAASEQDGAGVLYGAIVHRQDGQRDAQYFPPGALRISHFHTMPLAHASSFVRRSVYARLGLYRADFRLAGDYEFMLRCFSAGVAFTYLARPLAGVQGGGLSDTQNERYWEETQRVLHAYGFGRTTRLRHRAHVAKARLLRRLQATALGRRALGSYRALRSHARAAAAPPHGHA